MEPVNLLCEYLKNPLGLDETQPRFSWELRENERDKFQSAYQIIVSSSRDNAINNFGDIWDSGKVKTNQSTNVVYQGDTLKSGQQYYWKVRVWGVIEKEPVESELASFEMGLLYADDWEGSWITSSRPDLKGPLCRKEFILPEEIKKARVYLTGLGYYEFHVNGKKVGEEVLTPGWTDYNKRILYSTYDITNNLSKGKNVIGFILGNGRYTPAKEVVEKNPNNLQVYGETPAAILQLNIELKDGSRISTYTDNSWKISSGPILFNDIYDGEIYDARLEKPGWDLINYNDSEWEFAIKASPQPTGKLVSQATYPPIKICKTLQPQQLTSPRPGVYIYDFGQNFTGWIRVKAAGKAGGKIKLRFAELITDDGMLNTIPNRGAAATDIYILKGDREETYEPRFTYHGFRYVEVTGFPGIPSLDNIEGKVVHTAVDRTGNFYCSNDLINQLHNNIVWGQVSNLMSIPTDCPQRDERMGWMGDAQLVAEEAIYNFRMVGFYYKWLADVRDAQKEDGSVPDVVPPYWPLYPADPAWGTACMVIPWYVYLFYNDKRILERNYQMMKNWVRFLESNAKDNLISNLGKYGDWCPPWHVHSIDTSLELVSSWYYYHDTWILAKAASVLGKDGEAEEYNIKALKIKQAFNERFLEEDSYSGMQSEWYEKMIPIDTPEAEKEKRKERLRKSFGVASQTANILPLYLYMVPEEKKDQIIKTLVNDIKVIHNLHLNTGIVGTRYIMDVLTRNGYVDLAYQLATQTTYPSWGYMIKEGATTVWERWEYLADAGMNSHNHIMLGTVDAWFYKILAGINLDLSTPGLEKIVIKPVLVNGLNQASASLHTIRGLISVNWRKKHNTFTLKVVIPGNSKADIYLPQLGEKALNINEVNSKIWRDGSLTDTNPDIIAGKKDNNQIKLTVNPGSYHFSFNY